MAPPPGPYSGTSTLALVARVSAFSVGLVYGSLKLKYLQVARVSAFSVGLVYGSLKLKYLQVARVSAFSVGLVYGSLKLKYLQAKAKSHRKGADKGHH